MTRFGVVFQGLMFLICVVLTLLAITLGAGTATIIITSASLGFTLAELKQAITLLILEGKLK